MSTIIYNSTLYVAMCIVCVGYVCTYIVDPILNSDFRLPFRNLSNGYVGVCLSSVRIISVYVHNSLYTLMAPKPDTYWAA
jgi:hypothetical protein